MFAGFNLSIPDESFCKKYYDDGKDFLDGQKRLVEETLAKYTSDEKNLTKYASEEGPLDGTAIQNDWFHPIKADVFLSHAHRDDKLVVGLVGWLYKKCRVRAFVDSHIWGYANDLLKQIDDQYCVLKHNSDGSTTYSYWKCAESASHVHIMLNTALEQMVDKCECLLFVNTPNSLSVSTTMDENSTLSPWIYSELSISQTIRRKSLQDYRFTSHFFAEDSADRQSNLRVKYNVKMDHLKPLSVEDLHKWSEALMQDTTEYPLDRLYEQHGLLKANSMLISE